MDFERIRVGVQTIQVTGVVMAEIILGVWLKWDGQYYHVDTTCYASHKQALKFLL